MYSLSSLAELVLPGMTRLVALFSVLFLFPSALAAAQTLPPGFTSAQFGSDVATPTAMAFAPDGRLFVCQQGGQLRVIKNGTLLPTPFVSLTVDPNGERGLLGVAFDPDFATNNYVYVYYTTTETPRRNRVSRFTANGDVAVSGSEFVVVNLTNLSSATNHNGGAIHFGLDGKLYIAAGDNANGANAQTLANRHGKILRLNKDGTIPTDNPFYNQASGAARAIWALGLRNPFTFAVQPGTGRLFLNDVGQVSWEEVNEGVAGANYGWPDTEGYFNPASFPNYRNPIYAYSHTGDPGGCAIAGGNFYNPLIPRFPNRFLGQYFFADLCGGWVRYLDPDSPAASFDFASGFVAPVDIKTGPDGALYVLQRGGGGKVFRIAYAAQVSGRIALEECAPDAEPVSFTFQPANGDSFTRVQTVAADGSFTLQNIPVDTYNVAIKASKWLQKVVVIDTSAGDVSGVEAMLTAGDANNDNSVDVLDLDLLVQTFDTCEGDPGFIPGADFNCDGCADVLDLDILVRNFDTAGETLP